MYFCSRVTSWSVFKRGFCNLASGCVGKEGLETGWGRVGEGVGAGLGKGWGGLGLLYFKNPV